MSSRRSAAPTWWVRLVLSGVLFVGLALWLASIGTAAEGEAAEPTTEPVALPQPLSPQTIRDLVARLSDDQVRALLLSQLDKVAVAGVSPSEETDGFVDDLEEGASSVRVMWAQRIAMVPELPRVVSHLLGRLAEGKTTAQILLTVVGVIVVFGAGILAEWLFWWLTGKQRARIPVAHVDRFTTRLGYLLQRLAWQIAGVVVFAVATLAAFFALYQGHGPTRITMVTCLAAVVIIRLASDASRFLLAPHASALRLIPLDDAAAGRLHRWVLTLVIIAAVGILMSDLMEILDLDLALLAPLRALFGLILTAALIVAIWRSRRPIAQVIAGDGIDPSLGGTVRRVLANWWHVLGILYVVGIWLTVQIRVALGAEVSTGAPILSLLLVVALPLADVALRRIVGDYFETRRALAAREARLELEAVPAAEGEGLVVAEPEPVSSPYERPIDQGLRVVLWLAGILILCRLWGINIYTITQEGIGDTAAGALFNIVVTVLFAYVGWGIVKAAIDRRVELEGGPVAGEAGGEGGGQGASRLRTLLPLGRKAIFGTLVVMVIMIILSSLGVDIGPLLAGAGVIGLAVGFGAQTLVRDIVSGVFFLLDDAFRVGEYIDLGDVKGTVEKISIRSMQLRHHRGALNTVPFGEIKYLTNYSRDWAIMKLEFRVTYDTDVSMVKKIFKQINVELMENEEIAANLLEPLKSQGVLSMEDSAMIIRAKFTAKPGEQFVIRREVYARVQKAFDEAGIRFAHREVTVHVPEAAGSADPDRIGQAAGAAARRMIEDEDAQAAKATA